MGCQWSVGRTAGWPAGLNISIRVTARGSGHSRDLDRPDRPRPTHFDRLGRSESLDESLDSPRVVSSRSTEPLRTKKVDRKGRPRRSETRFSTISGPFSGRFLRFLEVASRERLDSQCEGPNPCFCRQAQYFVRVELRAFQPKIGRKSSTIRFASTSRASRAYNGILQPLFPRQRAWKRPPGRS